MDQKAVNKIVEAQEKMRTEPEVHLLLEEYQWCERRLRDLLKQLPSDQTGILMDYLGMLVQLQIKLLEFVAM